MPDTRRNPPTAAMTGKSADLWRLGRGLALDCATDRVAGIVNVTPDSFSDGGRHADTAAAVAHGRRLAADGADILDVGGESTRPGAAPVPLEAELARVVPVVAALAEALPGVVLSVDTYKAGCAAAAIEAGAAIINDVSACAFDPGLLDVVCHHKPGYVLMHSLGRPETMQRDPRYGDVVEDILAFFEEKLAMLSRAGLPEDRVVVDPGIGFGKRPEHNLEILRRLDRFLVLGRPVFLGLSNKSVFGACLNLPVGERGLATAVASALCSGRGARIHRLHDVAQGRVALGLAAALAA
ncbi:dihydropteroate synthase [Solidesulfovibrio carbinoliphilus subsp. oakridgensis]|uniref:Dihydropteroate synthase n=1 Tax=Solidesulfovibrio carbinoliphilus subsp. oakridgensis TaxID=694327 RepID=G7QDJ0_9BACT|nr:dihydropteroate synthase [Solidesulfovibrio carbinoliphilus]EHJ46496.1 dihydropteroate synthase [Solidesulfovibrio carbinoliphilus subsp. oakridgensis]